MPDFYSLTVQLQQDKDDADTESVVCQDLDVTVMSCPGGGCYLILKTERWAVEDRDELDALLGRVLKAAEVLGADATDEGVQNRAAREGEEGRGGD